MDAIARTRSLAVLEGAIGGEYDQPSNSDLKKICKRLKLGEEWTQVFPGVASINIVADGDGPSFCLRLTKAEGVPVRLIKEEEGLGGVVAIKRVNELDFYNLSPAQLAQKVGLTQPRSKAVSDALGLRKNLEYFKLIRVGKVSHNRYSQKAIKAIQDHLEHNDINEIWANYRAQLKGR